MIRFVAEPNEGVNKCLACGEEAIDLEHSYFVCNVVSDAKLKWKKSCCEKGLPVSLMDMLNFDYANLLYSLHFVTDVCFRRK